MKYLNLCSEEYYLSKNGYLAKSVWAVWEGDLKKRRIASPVLQGEWANLRAEYLSRPDFVQYGERIQAEHRVAKASAAFG
jgi:hypothetical protein